jgi:hypothetical protein
MTTAAVQQAIAQLVTDSTARRAFMAGDDTLLAAYALSPQELIGFSQLRTRGRAGLELFADQLNTRRARRVAALLPLSTALLGDRVWTQAWSTYAAGAAREPYTPPEADASRFAALLATRAREGEPVVAAVVHYERCKAAITAAPRTARPDTGKRSPIDGTIGETYPLIHPSWRCEPFDYDLLAAVHELKKTGVLPALGGERIHVLFYRSWRSGKVHTARVSSPVPALLARCDGRHQYQNVLECGAPRAVVERTLTRLELAGVLVFARSAHTNNQLDHQ